MDVLAYAPACVKVTTKTHSEVYILSYQTLIAFPANNELRDGPPDWKIRKGGSDDFLTGIFRTAFMSVLYVLYNYANVIVVAFSSPVDTW